MPREGPGLNRRGFHPKLGRNPDPIERAVATCLRATALLLLLLWHSLDRDGSVRKGPKVPKPLLLLLLWLWLRRQRLRPHPWGCRRGRHLNRHMRAASLLEGNVLQGRGGDPLRLHAHPLGGLDDVRDGPHTVVLMLRGRDLSELARRRTSVSLLLLLLWRNSVDCKVLTRRRTSVSLFLLLLLWCNSVHCLRVPHRRRKR